MSYTKPQLSLIQTPSHFSPVYAPNWFAFTSSSTASTATNINLVADVYILDQGLTVSTITDYPGRFKVPVRENNTFVFDPQQIIKSYVTFPYNNGRKVYYGSGTAQYVNECVGFGSPTSSFPTLAPEQDGIVKYQIQYGLEYNPGATFAGIVPAGTASISGTCSTFAILSSVNMFATAGDLVQVQVNSGLYSYYNGTASILSIINDGTNTFVTTDKVYNYTLGALGVDITGSFITAVHLYGTSSAFYGYNGTRQYNEKDVNFDNVYYLKEYGATSSLFPSSSTQSNFQFMNDFGRDYTTAIPIRNGQSERTRFMADLQGSTNRLILWKMETYNSSLTLINTQTSSLLDNPGSQLYPYKCFTVQLFTKDTVITDGNYYKFSIGGLNHLGANMYYASIWYKGYDPCSKYINYRIKFLNKQGTWAYWNFNMDNKKTTTIKRTEFKTPLQYNQTFNTIAGGGSSTVDSPFSLTKLRGNNILSISATETFSLNSDWISEEQYAYLEQLIASSQVYIFYETYTLKDNTILTAVNIPIIITDASFSYKTVNRDRLFNLTINYKNAFDENIQNL